MNAQVVVASIGFLQLDDGWPTDTGAHFSVQTDQQGRFLLDARRDTDVPVTTYVVHEAGTAVITGKNLEHGTITLAPWRTVRGVTMRHGDPTADASLLMRAGHFPWEDVGPNGEIPPIAPPILSSATTRSDSNGKFTFDRVPAMMEGDVHRTFEDGSWGFCAHFSSPQDELGPIEPDWLCVDGCTVVGQFEMPEMKERITAASVQIVRRGFQQPPGYESLSDNEQFEIYKAWCDTPEGKRANGRTGYAILQLDDDGHFRAVDVPAGVPLKIEASFYDNVGWRPFDNLLRWILRQPREITVTREITLTKQREPIDVGMIA